MFVPFKMGHRCGKAMLHVDGSRALEAWQSRHVSAKQSVESAAIVMKICFHAVRVSPPCSDGVLPP